MSALVLQQHKRGQNVVQVQAACGQVQQSHVPYGSCSLIIRPRCLLGCVECAQPSARPHGRITYLCRPLAPWTLPHASAAQEDSGTAGRCWTGMVKQHSISPWLALPEGFCAATAMSILLDICGGCRGHRNVGRHTRAKGPWLGLHVMCLKCQPNCWQQYCAHKTMDAPSTCCEQGAGAHRRGLKCEAPLQTSKDCHSSRAHWTAQLLVQEQLASKHCVLLLSMQSRAPANAPGLGMAVADAVAR
jgi:hypothetical protein